MSLGKTRLYCLSRFFNFLHVWLLFDNVVEAVENGFILSEKCIDLFKCFVGRL